MAELQVFKAKINNACTLLKTIEADIKRLDEPFTFPEGRHLELESHQLEVAAAQWQNKVQFRQQELREQSNVLQSTAPSISSNNSEGTASGRSERSMKIRRPMLEIPSFSGNFREFNSFWAVFESLVHNDDELSDIDKFLFLKQALKGRAAVTISCIPVVGDRYHAAVNILKKQFDRSANMADIIINEIERLQRASESPRSCRETFEAINSRIIHLEQTGMRMNADRVWRRMILSKFPEFICTTVIQKETECDHSFDVSEIMNTIDDVIALRETTALTTETLFPKDSYRNGLPKQGINRTKFGDERNTPRRQKGLCLCGQQHSPHSCPKYTTPQARRFEVRKQKACWRCFAKNHQSKDCTVTGLCPRCNEGHHSSLCLSETKRQDTGYLTLPRQPGRNVQLPPAARTQQPPANGVSRNHRYQGDNRNVQTMHNQQNGRQIPTLDNTTSVSNQFVLQIATAMIFNEAEWDYQPVTLLLDSGAQKSFIKSGISEELKLRITGSTSFTISGMGELQETFNSNEVQVTLKGLHSPKKLKKLSVHTKQKLTTSVTTAELSEADLNFISSSNVTVAQQTLARTSVSPDLLIGQDLLSTIIDHGSPVLTLPSGLILTPTVFGYTISGTSLTKTKTSAEVHGSALVIASPAVSSREDYKQDIKNLYELESLGLKTENDPDEASIIKFMDDYRKTIQIKEGVITAGFPFNENADKLKDNFNVAFRRLQALLRTLRDDKEKLRIYNDTFQTYIKEGIIEECAFNPTGVTAFYLPHRHVWTPGKSTELRVVFDASSHGRNEFSLNDVIYEGHALTPLIHEVLLQFRTHKNTMVADIQKAFLQIRLPDHHRDATRFLWIKDLDSPAEGDNVKYYRFCRVPFGINASPAILNQSILKHIEEENSPIGKELSRSLYVDNILLEGETSDDLIRKYTASKQVFSSIGMNLRDYLSNSSTVNESIKESDRAKDKEIKVLGLSWNSIDDTLSFTCTEKAQKKISKRTVLSQINGFCFDPLGLLTPLIVPAKVFLQDIHKMKLGWDTPLPDEASQQWNSIRSNIIGFSKSIPRKVLEKDPKAEHIMSIFVDSSK
ncbi:hypothetical protein Aduo_011917 [Ancylostoma duodenale]